MNGEDSFNDSDEVSTLYSSKKTTQAFKTQFQKLLSGYSSVNGGDIDTQENDAREEKSTLPNATSHERDNRREKEIETSIEILVNDNSMDDSIEILEETRRGNRRSERLRNKRPSTSSEINNCSDTVRQIRKVPVRKRKSMTQKQGKKTKIDEVVLDNSQDSCQDYIEEDELNPEVSVKVIWKSVTIKKFIIRRFQKMAKIFEDLSKEESIPQDQVLLTFNNVRVNADDTPDSLNLQVYHFLDGGVLFECKKLNDVTGCKVSNDSGDSISLKFQDVNKKVLKIFVHKNEKIKVAMIKCCEQLEVPLEKVKFFLDGEPLTPSETPSALGLENDEIIDFKIHP